MRQGRYLRAKDTDIGKRAGVLEDASGLARDSPVGECGLLELSRELRLEVVDLSNVFESVSDSPHAIAGKTYHVLYAIEIENVVLRIACERAEIKIKERHSLPRPRRK